MTRLEKLKYNFGYWKGRIFGFTQGTNSKEIFQKAILDDIERMKDGIKVVSCTLDDEYWSKDVVDALKKKKDSERRIYIEFLVGPDMKNQYLEKQSDKGRLFKITRLKKKPPFDFRIIDGMDTYSSEHGSSEDGSGRKFLRTFKNRPSVNYINNCYEGILEENNRLAG